MNVIKQTHIPPSEGFRGKIQKTYFIIRQKTSLRDREREEGERYKNHLPKVISPLGLSKDFLHEKNAQKQI